MIFSLIGQKGWAGEGRGGVGWGGKAFLRTRVLRRWRLGVELALFETGESRLVESMAVAAAAFCTLHQHWWRPNGAWALFFSTTRLAAPRREWVD